MKKLLVLLALCMVFSVVLVACNNNTENPEETTAGSTEAPTQGETEAPTTETQAPTTEPAPAKKGCGGMIAGGVAIIAILGTALIIKKED